MATDREIEQGVAGPPVDYWFCGPGTPHEWLYRGKNKGYRCQQCGTVCSKEQLKAATDA